MLDGVNIGDRLLTKAEVCVLIGCSWPHLWKMQKAGRFPAGRYIGVRVFWRLSEIEAFIDSLPRVPPDAVKRMTAGVNGGRARAVAARRAAAGPASTTA